MRPPPLSAVVNLAQPVLLGHCPAVHGTRRWPTGGLANRKPMHLAKMVLEVVQIRMTFVQQWHWNILTCCVNSIQQTWDIGRFGRVDKHDGNELNFYILPISFFKVAFVTLATPVEPAQTRAPFEGQTKSFERRPKACSFVGQQLSTLLTLMAFNLASGRWLSAKKTCWTWTSQAIQRILEMKSAKPHQKWLGFDQQQKNKPCLAWALQQVQSLLEICDASAERIVAGVLWMMLDVARYC